MDRIKSACILCGLFLLGTRNASGLETDFTPYARTQEDGGLVYSLGRPFRVLRYSAIFDAGASLDVPGNVEPTGHARFNFAYDLLNPVVRPLSLIGELGLGFQSNRYQALYRAQLGISLLHVAVGMAGRTNPASSSVVLTLWHPIRRGGVLGGGSLLRLDWLPGFEQTLTLGVEIPLSNEGTAGRTRPLKSAIAIGNAVATHAGALGNVTQEEQSRLELAREQALWIYRLTTPPIDRDSEGTFFQSEAPGYLATLQKYGGTDGLVRAYHHTLAQEFKSACGAPCEKAAGKNPWDLARRVLLEEVLIPYDRLLGANKDPSGSLGGFTRTAAGRFAREAVVAFRLSPEELEPVQRAFNDLLDIVGEVQRVALKDWEESNRVWLPLSLGLLPEEHETQAQMDRLIMALTQVPMTTGNSLRGLSSLQFLSVFAESVRDAKNYHVLWIHDYKGVTGEGKPDRAAAWASIDVYMEALIRNVSRYDQTHRMPVYMIFLDQWYYELNKSWIFLKPLEEPLTAKLSLPVGYERIEARFKDAQRRLREAIQKSRLLQAQIRQFGEKWLENLIQVHVNITNPSDPSFWRNEVVPIVGLPDDVMRDHRKIIFYDLSEDAPGRGAAIFTGMGIGEEYASLKWIDRGLELRGPAALRLKNAAYHLLRQQGIPEEKIPLPLRPIPGLALKPTGSASDTRVLQLHNPTGFAIKEINPLKAALYTLMPPGSFVVVPDSLWSNPLWASMLAASALRGGRSYLVAPSKDNAPGVGFPGISRAHDLFAELIRFRNVFGNELRKRGGRIEVGLFNPKSEVADLKATLTEILDKFEHDPVVRGLFPMPPSSIAKLKALLPRLKSSKEAVLRRVSESSGAPKSKLHAKINAAASAEAWRWFWSQGVVADALVQLVSDLDEEIMLSLRTPGAVGIPLQHSGRLRRLLDELVRRRKDLSRQQLERHVSYFTSGSHNSNLRSMLMDGEVLVGVTGLGGLIGVNEMLSILARTEWVRDVPELEHYLPNVTGWKRSFSRWIQILQ